MKLWAVNIGFLLTLPPLALSSGSRLQQPLRCAPRAISIFLFPSFGDETPVCAPLTPQYLYFPLIFKGHEF